MMHGFRRWPLLLVVLLIAACGSPAPVEIKPAPKAEVGLVQTADYDCFIPSAQPKILLVLFPGFPEDAARTQAEFPIKELAEANDAAVLYMNFNMHLYLEEADKANLVALLDSAMHTHHLNPERIVIGGFSSGGIVSLLLSNYMLETNHDWQPNGTFMIDSPPDLVGLYSDMKADLTTDFPDWRLAEPQYLVDLFESDFEMSGDIIAELGARSIYVSGSGDATNIAALKNIPVRLYTEPDTAWWAEARMSDYEEMNARYIRDMYQGLKAEDWAQLELIETVDKGYRSNGERHPHSWSIVDKPDLFKWIVGDAQQ